MRPKINKWPIVLIFIAILAWRGSGQAEAKVSDDRDQVVRTLHRYVQLRLQDANWAEYSKFITWPDEPSWDCKWVTSAHKIGTPVKREQGFAIPVVYTRLGLFCGDFDFKPEPRVVTIEYELVQRPTGWKVSAPVPNYPDIGEGVLVKSLSAMAENANETPERRTKAKTTARKIREALKQETTTAPNPHTN